jgi:hypothetical protein
MSGGPFPPSFPVVERRKLVREAAICTAIAFGTFASLLGLASLVWR